MGTFQTVNIWGIQVEICVFSFTVLFFFEIKFLILGTMCLFSKLGHLVPQKLMNFLGEGPNPSDEFQKLTGPFAIKTR